MNSSLAKIIKKNNTEPFNTDLSRGIVRKMLSHEELERVVVSMCNEVLDKSGLDGLKLDRVTLPTVIQEVGKLTQSYRNMNKNKLPFDRNDMYMIVLNLSYKGKELNKVYMRLPIIGDGGKIVLNNTPYWVKPVLIRPGISIHKKSIYVWLLRANYNIKRELHNILVNGQITTTKRMIADLNQMSTAAKASTQAKNSDRLKVKIPPSLYLVMKGGLNYACELLGITNIQFINDDYDNLKNTVDTSKFAICSPLMTKPKGIHISRWTECTFKIIVPIEDLRKSHINIFISEILYIVSHFGSYAIVENLMEKTTIWRMMGAHMIYNTNDTPAILMDKVNKHIETSVDKLVDEISKADLAVGDIVVDNMYELIAYIIKYSDEVYKDYESSSMDKNKMEVIRYTLGRIAFGFTKLSYSLDNLKSIKDKDKYHTDATIIAELNKLFAVHITPHMLSQITKYNGEVLYEVNAGDNYLFRATMGGITQINTNKLLSRKSARGGLVDPINKLHSSMIEFGRFFILPGNNPGGKNLINPVLDINLSTGKITNPYKDKYKNIYNHAARIIDNNKFVDYSEITNKINYKIVYNK